jgi:uncharacterized protein YbjT (DUF2867 family)
MTTRPTVLVTGATGRPGSHVIRAFVAHGEPVRALVREPAKRDALESMPGVDVAVGDMLSPHTLTAALDGIQRVLVISNAGPAMLETQCTFIDAAVSAGVAHIVKFSGKEAANGFDSSRFRSSRSHDQIERYLVASAEHWTVLLPSQFMQVFFEEVPSIVADGEIRLPLGDTTLAPVDLHDVAQVAYAVLTTDGHHGKRYEMTGPEALTMGNIASAISDAVGSNVRYVDVTSAEKRTEWIRSGYPPERADAFLQLFEERKRLGRSNVNLTTHEQFGVDPTTFAAFATRHAAVFSGHAGYAVTHV